MRAAGMVAPPLAREERGHLHEAGPFARAAVLAPRQDRHEVGKLSWRSTHDSPRTSFVGHHFAPFGTAATGPVSGPGHRVASGRDAGGGAGRRRGRADRRPRTGRARLRRGGPREPGDPRRQGAQPARARFGCRRPSRPPGRARLSLLPGLLPAPAGHDEPDPHGPRDGARPVDGGHPRDDRPGGWTQRVDQRRPPSRLAGRPRGPQPVLAPVDGDARHPAGRADGAHGAAAHTAHELRRAALRAVGAAELVGVRRRTTSLGRLPAVPGRRAHPHARRGQGAGDQRPHRGPHPRPTAVRRDPGRWSRRSCARRPDERGVDRPVGRARAQPGCRPAPRLPRAGPHRRRRPHLRRHDTRGQRAPPISTSPPCRWRSCARSPGRCVRWSHGWRRSTVSSPGG